MKEGHNERNIKRRLTDKEHSIRLREAHVNQDLSSSFSSSDNTIIQHFPLNVYNKGDHKVSCLCNFCTCNIKRFGPLAFFLNMHFHFS